MGAKLANLLWLVVVLLCVCIMHAMKEIDSEAFYECLILLGIWQAIAIKDNE